MKNRRERLRVMLFTETFTIGGTEQQLVELAKRLDPTRYEVVIGCKFREGPLLSELERAQLQVFELPMNSFHEVNAIRQLARLVNFLCTHRIQILHTTGNMGNTFVALAGLLARVPVIITSRRDLGDLTPAKLKFFQKIFAKAASAVLVNAECIKELLIEQEKIVPEKIQTIHNGVNLARFDVSPVETAAVRREFGFDQSAPIVGVVGALRPIKGQDYFLKAFRQVYAHFPESRALIVGESDGDWGKQLQRQSHALGLNGQVIFAGYRADIPALLSATSLFVLPSLSEGLPNALMEAMAIGVPVVATAVGGTMELVTDGESGLLVPPGDSEQMASAMIKLLSDKSLGTRLARTARQRIRQLNADRMVRETEALYERLIDEAAPLFATEFTENTEQ